MPDRKPPKKFVRKILNFAFFLQWQNHLAIIVEMMTKWVNWRFSAIIDLPLAALGAAGSKSSVTPAVVVLLVVVAVKATEVADTVAVEAIFLTIS